MKTLDTKRLFSALANQLRLNIINALRKGELSVSDIVDAVGAQQSAVSHNLTPLIKVGLVAVRREGSFRFYSLQSENVLPLFRHLDEWREMVDSVAATAARESRQNFDRLFRIAPVGIFIGTQGRATFANPAAAKMFGLTNSTEAMGMSAYDFIPESARPQMKSILDRLHRGQKVRDAHVRMRRFDGKEIDVEVDAAPLQREKRMSVVMLRDITERRELEERLSVSEARYRRVFEESPLGIIIQDAKGRYLRANRRFCRMIGYTERELKKKNFLELTHPDSWKADHQAFVDLTSGKIDHYLTEKKYVTKSGSVIWARSNVAAFRGPDGKALFFQILVEDICKEKESRDQSIAAEERCRRLLRRGPDSVCTVDGDGIIRSVLCCRSDLGKRAKIGRKIVTLLPVKMRPGLLRAIKAAIRTGRPQLVEKDCRTAGKTEAYICHVAKVARATPTSEVSVCATVTEP